MSTTITVTSAAELNQALSQASGGETILLAPGNYGKLVINNSQFASNVTIKSADPNAMASFSETYVSNSSNVTFEEIKFDYTYASGDRDHHSPFQINYSSNITIDNSVFDGDLASGTGIGRGLVIRGSTDVDVVNTEFHSWWKALSAVQSTNLNFIGNNIHTIRSDGISLGEVQNVLIENNYIHDFGGLAGSGDHRDMIQIQRASGTGSSDIYIRNNVLDIGAGDYAQGIWAGADKGNISDPTHWNYNIVIENNVLYNAHSNGIALHMTDGATISNNTVIAVPTQQTGGVTIPKIILAVGSQNITITDNVAPAIVGYIGQPHFNVQNNVITQNTDPSAPGYYDTQFVYHATSAADGYNQYGVIPGSAVDLQNAGSSLVDGYPFSYYNWVGSSSTSVNPGTTAPGSGASAPTAPDSGASAPTAPDSGASAPTAPDSDASSPTGPDSDASAPTAPDSDASAPTGPDSDASAPTAPDSDASSPTGPDSDASAPTAPDSGASTPTAPDSGASTPTAPDSGASTPTAPDSGASTPTAPDSDGPRFPGGFDGFFGGIIGGVNTGGGGGQNNPLNFDWLSQAGFSEPSSFDFVFSGNDTVRTPQLPFWGNGNATPSTFGPAISFGGIDTELDFGGGRGWHLGFGSNGGDRADSGLRDNANDGDVQFVDTFGGFFDDLWG